VLLASIALEARSISLTALAEHVHQVNKSKCPKDKSKMHSEQCGGPKVQRRWMKIECYSHGPADNQNIIAVLPVPTDNKLDHKGTLKYLLSTQLPN